jgi:hypothetical protein
MTALALSKIVPLISARPAWAFAGKGAAAPSAATATMATTSFNMVISGRRPRSDAV